MYRVHKMTGTIYAYDFGENLEDEAENIQEFLDQGEIVLLGDDLECLAEFLGVEEDEIETISEDPQ